MCNIVCAHVRGVFELSTYLLLSIILMCKNSHHWNKWRKKSKTRLDEIVYATESGNKRRHGVTFMRSNWQLK